MVIKFSRRGAIRAVCLLSVLILALSALALVNGRRAMTLERQSRTATQHALRELGEHLDNITTALQKAHYAGSGKLLSQAERELSRSAACAKISLSALTNEDTNTENVYKFLSQVGDFTRAMQTVLERKGRLTEKQRDSLDALLRYAQSFSDALHTLDAEADDGLLRYGAENKTLTLAAAKAPAVFDERFNSSTDALSETPTLLYDGPFSDTVLNRKALFVAGRDEIDVRTARARAAKWLDCKQTALQTDSETNGALALFCFSKGEKRIGVTKRGGLLAYVTNPAFSGAAQISPETAVKIAARYLSSVGYPEMQARYYSTYDGICTVVFHYVKDGVVWYADLIKVGVALDTAQPVSIDARGFLMNHTTRRLPEIKVSAEAAAAALAPGLKLIGTRTALIPLDDGSERLCHELHCRDKSGQEALIYTDVTNGEETDVQILLYADGGILAK